MSRNAVARTQAELDAEVRRTIYDSFISDHNSISMEQVAARLGEKTATVGAVFGRLAEARVLVLQPGSGEVLMAAPFSAVPTAFRVEAASGAWWGNCIWDALGVIAMTGVDASVITSCADCGEAMSLTVEGSDLRPAQAIAHFAIPAAHWWDDVVFT